MSRPNWMIENVIAGLQNLVAELETIAASNTLDPAKAAAISTVIATGPAASLATPAITAIVPGLSGGLVALYKVLPVLVSGVTGIDPSVAPALFALARGIGAAMDPADAATAFATAVDALADAAPPPTTSQNRIDDAANMQIIARFSRMVLLAPYAEAVVRVTYASRPDGVTARADCVERYEREIGLATGPNGGSVSLRLVDVRNRVVDTLSRLITRLDDVVTVRANRSLPSLWWAWRLYQDPTRAIELVARNDVAHPSFMPLGFQALAPSPSS